MIDPRDELLVVVASLYYEQNQNQQQIADRLEISRSSVSRLIKEARDRGIVQIQIDKPTPRDFELEQALIDRFDLKDAYVLGANNEAGGSAQPNGQDEDARLHAVGRLAAGYLQRVIDNLSPGSYIGIAWGTGVYVAVSALAEDRSKQINVVQMLGSVGAPNSLIDGPDLARLVAGKLGGRHYYLHAPVLLEQPALQEMLYNEPAVRDGLERARSVQLAITGVGTVQDETSSFLRAGHLTSEDLAYLRSQGIVGETCGRFFDAWGNCNGYEINQRVVGIALSDLRQIPRVIAVARGLPKARSILGALRGHYLTVLATDDVTARAILTFDDQDRGLQDTSR